MTTAIDPDTVTIPDSPEALAEFLNEPSNVGALLATPGAFQDYVAKYARVVLNKHTEIQQQVTEQVEQAMAAFVKENADPDHPFGPAAIADMSGHPGARKGASAQAKADMRAGLANPRAIGTKIDKGFEHNEGLADYMQLIWHNANRDSTAQARLREIRNAFTSTEGAGGGFLIPEVLRTEILRVNLESSIVRPRARVVPMESLKVNFPAIDSTSNVSSVYGGIVSYWEEEGASHTESDPEFQAIELLARKLVSYTTVPNELMTDAIGALQMFFSELYPEALAFDEDYAFLTGNGVGKPLGALNTTNAGTIEVAAEGGQAASTIVWENIINMYSRMLPASLNRAVWVVSQDVFPQLATMALSVGTGGVPVWLPDGTGAPQLTLLGRPVIQSEKTPAALGTRGDISFWDPGFYLIGDRQMMSASSSEHVKFREDKTAFKIVSRVDGKPWLQNAITPRNNGSTLGACVQLATRS